MKLNTNILKPWKGAPSYPGPLLLVVLDGIGIAPDGPANAVSLANTPTLDHLRAHCRLQRQLKAHGPAVGLPSWDDMGNSEVGHNALGAGRIFDQGAKLVKNAIASGALFATPLWQQFVALGKKGKTIHLLGLVSDGNVHSHIDHLLAMLQAFAAAGVRRLAVHALLDGRDVEPRSALKYLKRLEQEFERLKASYGCQAFVASGGGRMRITMDRYNADWQMVERGWHCHVLGQGKQFSSAQSAIESQYQTDPDSNDQTLEGFVIVDAQGRPLAPIEDGEGVIFFNFRGDRAIEITRAFCETDFEAFERQRHPQVLYAGMMQYDGDLQIPKNHLVAPPQLKTPMSEYVCALKIPSFAISETQKYGHITYFWNGNRSGYIEPTLERYVEIPSDRVPFNHAPEMKAKEITDAAIDMLRSGKYRFGRLNFPNGDMVGHTGDLAATIKAVEAVDIQLRRLIDCVDSLGGVSVILADHGNADEMYTMQNGVKIIKTSHTLNPVPFFIVDRQHEKSYRLTDLPEAGLANVAATLLNLLGYEKPDDYQPSLLELSRS